jgi:hypothetical protein
VMLGKVLRTFSNNVLLSPTNCLTPRPSSLSETFRYTKPAAKGHIPQDRCGYLKSRTFTLSCSPSPRIAVPPGMAHDVTTTDYPGVVKLRCDLQRGHNQVFGHQSFSLFIHAKLSLQPACQNSVKCFT